MKNLFFIFLIFIFSCEKKIEENIIARVNKDKLTKNNFIKIYNIEDYNKVDIEKKIALINSWIEITMLSQYFDINENKDINSIIEMKNKQIKSNYTISKIVDNIVINDEEILDYYRLNKPNFTVEKVEYKLQIMTIGNKKKYNTVKEIIANSGKKFSEIAKEYSDDKFAKNGGFTGFISTEEIDSGVLEKILNGIENKLYFIYSNNKYFIFRFYDKKIVKNVTELEKIKEQIYNNILQKRKVDSVKDFIKELYQSNNIEINI